jgi:hypothetical protein
MNAKQIVPLIAAGSTLAAAAPVLLIGGAAIIAILWLFSDDEKPTDAEKPNEAEPMPDPRPPEFMPVSITSPAPEPESLPSMAIQEPPVVLAFVAPVVPYYRRNVTREDLSAVFSNGSRILTRQAAVAALKQFGFGKTAAYKALSTDGRFASLLLFAPDGMISWKC